MVIIPNSATAVYAPAPEPSLPTWGISTSQPIGSQSLTCASGLFGPLRDLEALGVCHEGLPDHDPDFGFRATVTTGASGASGAAYSTTVPDTITDKSYRCFWIDQAPIVRSMTRDSAYSANELEKLQMSEGHLPPAWQKTFNDLDAQAWAGEAFKQIRRNDPTATDADIRTTLDEVATNDRKQLRDRDPEAYAAHREIAAAYASRWLRLKFKGPTS